MNTPVRENLKHTGEGKFNLIDELKWNTNLINIENHIPNVHLLHGKKQRIGNNPKIFLKGILKTNRMIFYFNFLNKSQTGKFYDWMLFFFHQ
jgi:hypothetical protein